MAIDFLHDPPNIAPVTEIFAVVSRDREGKEGICATLLPGLGSIPALTGRENLARLLLQKCREDMKGKTDKTIHLIRFINREEIA